MTYLGAFGGGNDGATATGTTMTMTVPSGVSDGDVGLIALTVGSTSATLTTPTGWTLLSGPDDQTSGLRTYLLKRSMLASDSGTTVTCTISATGRLSGVGVVLTAVDYATVAIGTVAKSGNTAITMPTLSVAVANTDVVGFYLWNTGTFTPDSITYPGTPTPTKRDQNTTLFASGNRYASAVATFPEGATGSYGGGSFLPTNAAVQEAYIVSVAPANSNVAPTAHAGADQTAVEPFTTVHLDGSGSTDSDGTVASYAWTQTGGTTVTLSSSSVAQPTFKAPATKTGGTLTFSLVVTDDDGAPSTADTVSVTVLPHTVFRIDSGGPTPVQITAL